MANSWGASRAAAGRGESLVRCDGRGSGGARWGCRGRRTAGRGDLATSAICCRKQAQGPEDPEGQQHPGCDTAHTATPPLPSGESARPCLTWRQGVGGENGRLAHGRVLWVGGAMSKRQTDPRTGHPNPVRQGGVSGCRSRDEKRPADALVSHQQEGSNDGLHEVSSAATRLPRV